MAVKSMLATLLCVCASFSHAEADDMPWVQVGKDKKSFVLEPSGKPFTPWGFNYDHDNQGRLIPCSPSLPVRSRHGSGYEPDRYNDPMFVLRKPSPSLTVPEE